MGISLNLSKSHFSCLKSEQNSIPSLYLPYRYDLMRKDIIINLIIWLQNESDDGHLPFRFTLFFLFFLLPLFTHHQHRRQGLASGALGSVLSTPQARLARAHTPPCGKHTLLPYYPWDVRA